MIKKLKNIIILIPAIIFIHDLFFKYKQVSLDFSFLCLVYGLLLSIWLLQLAWILKKINETPCKNLQLKPNYTFLDILKGTAYIITDETMNDPDIETGLIFNEKENRFEISQIHSESYFKNLFKQKKGK